MGIFNKIFSTDNAPETTEATRHLSQRPRNHSACPSCGAVFANPPKRKVTCPECKAVCYLRTKQPIFNSDILTEEQMLAADFFVELMEYGVSADDYSKKEQLLTEKWGFKPNPYDVVWDVSMTCLDKYAVNVANKHDAPGFLHKAKMLAFSQAKYQAKRGHSPSKILAQVSQYDAEIQKLHWENIGVDVKKYTIETYNCCSACNKYQGKAYSLDEIKTNSPLPVEKCTYTFDKKLKPGWCTCTYQAVADL